MSNRAKKAQEKVIQMKLDEMLTWYAATSTSPELPQLCVDKKTYRGIVMRWLEPLLPTPDNPLLIEEQLGDYWTVRLESVGPKVQL